jgi:hypothetical protein
VAQAATDWQDRAGVVPEIDAVFVAVQANGETGMRIDGLAQLLASSGIQDAVLADGSDSATLVVDGSVEVAPGYWLKNPRHSGWSVILLA